MAQHMSQVQYICNEWRQKWNEQKAILSLIATNTTIIFVAAMRCKDINIPCHNECYPLAPVKIWWKSPQLCCRSPDTGTGSISATSGVDHVWIWEHVLVEKWPVASHSNHVNAPQKDFERLHRTVLCPSRCCHPCSAKISLWTSELQMEFIDFSTGNSILATLDLY